MLAAEKVRPSAVLAATGYDPRDPPAKPGRGRQGQGPRESKGTGVAFGPDDKSLDPTSVGSGVVIDERRHHPHQPARGRLGQAAEGDLLQRHGVSDAYIVGAQPEDDLAVITPRRPCPTT